MPARARSRTSRPSRAAGGLAALSAATLACASGPPPAPPPPEWGEASTREAAVLEAGLASEGVARADALVLRLAFAADVDLDLYVTDPRLETLYYANTPIGSGGELLADRRCDTPDPGGPRVEVARFEAPLPGRYRVGVDFPERCDGETEVAPFALTIDAQGERRSLRGLAEYLHFRTVVIEFELPARE